MKNCLVCKHRKFTVVWNDKIRVSTSKFSKKREKILQCQNCDLVFLNKRRKYLEDSSITRNLYNKNNSIKEFLKFHTSRETEKLNFIKEFLKFKNKKILESNCGAGIIINQLKNQAKLTAGLDNKFYKEFVNSNDHLFYSTIEEIIKNKKKFDIIFSLSEIEHKYDPKVFINKLKKILSKNGIIVFRIPNYYNIYMFLLGKKFFKYDYRLSHNFYFSERNLNLFFEDSGFEILNKSGFNEYNFNHLLTYISKKRRVKKNEIKSFFKSTDQTFIKKNLENSLTTTSLIYIIKSRNFK